MASAFTWAQLRTKIENDLDLKDEIFITQEELLGYANEAIDEAEQEILTIYEDYFLTRESLALVTGVDEYDLPADIWAHKIRAILYNSPSLKYPIRKIKELPEVNADLTGVDTYRYLIVNSLVDGPKIKIYPASLETSSANVTIWFIRNAKEIVLDDDVIDVPEAHKFIMQHIKLRCYEKEGSPNQDKATSDLLRERELLVSTLSAMIPDEDNHMLLDTSFYEDFYCDYHCYPHKG